MHKAFEKKKNTRTSITHLHIAAWSTMRISHRWGLQGMCCMCCMQECFYTDRRIGDPPDVRIAFIADIAAALWFTSSSVLEDLYIIATP